MVLPASRKTARITVIPDRNGDRGGRRRVASPLNPLTAVLLDPLTRPGPVPVRLGERRADAGSVARRDVVLLHERLVDVLPVSVLGANELTHLTSAALTGPRLDET